MRSVQVYAICSTACPASSVAHLDQTRVMPDGMARVFSWYDNEWGFSKRMLDTASLLLA